MKTDPIDYQQRFLECNEKFDTIFRLTSTASKIIAPDLTILKVNQAMADLIGYTTEEIEGIPDTGIRLPGIQSTLAPFAKDLMGKANSFF